MLKMKYNVDSLINVYPRNFNYIAYSWPNSLLTPSSNLAIGSYIGILEQPSLANMKIETISEPKLH